MTDAERTTTTGQMLEDYRRAKEELVLLEHQGLKEAQELARLAELLRKGPPYPDLPRVGVDAGRLQTLFKDWHDAYERKTSLGSKLRDLGLDK